MEKDSGRSVLVLSEVRGDTRRYRSLHLVEQLLLADIPCEFAHMADPDIWRIIDRPWSLVVLHRVAYGIQVGRVIEKLQSQGSVVVSDFDDLIFDLSAFPFINSPDFVDPIRVDLYKQNIRDTRKTLDLSDAVLASTGFLAERIRQMGKPVWVHRNAFSMEMLACSEVARCGRSEKTNGRIVIGYASGTPTHNRDFEMIKPALLKVMDRFPQAYLRLIGPVDLGHGWEELGERVQRKPLVAWRTLPKQLAEFDINLAPLVLDNPFTQSKSEIKYMEAAMVQIPTIASPTDAFEYAIRHGENGFLADSVDDWIEALSSLIVDANLREEVAVRAYTEVMKMYHPVMRVVQLAETLDEIMLQLRGEPFWANRRPEMDELLERARQYKSDDRWFLSPYETDPSKMRLGVFSFKNRGWKTLTKQVWVFMRRCAAPIFPFQEQKRQV